MCVLLQPICGVVAVAVADDFFFHNRSRMVWLPVFLAFSLRLAWWWRTLRFIICLNISVERIKIYLVHFGRTFYVIIEIIN